MGVTVQDGSIVNIRLVEGFGQEVVKETVYNEVIRGQALLVDVHSGATVSSKAYLKAIENALETP